MNRRNLGRAGTTKLAQLVVVSTTAARITMKRTGKITCGNLMIIEMNRPIREALCRSDLKCASSVLRNNPHLEVTWLASVPVVALLQLKPYAFDR